MTACSSSKAPTRSPRTSRTSIFNRPSASISRYFAKASAAVANATPTELIFPVITIVYKFPPRVLGDA